MLKLLLIIAGIIAVILVLIGAGAYITYVQAKKLIEIAKDDTLKADINDLVNNNNCSKLPTIETKVIEIKSSLESGCKNPIIKYAINKYSKEMNLCDINALDAQITPSLIQVKAYCANQTNSSA